MVPILQKISQYTEIGTKISTISFPMSMQYHNIPMSCTSDIGAKHDVGAHAALPPLAAPRLAAAGPLPRHYNSSSLLILGPTRLTVDQGES
jgi:hypothetical protein